MGGELRGQVPYRPNDLCRRSWSRGFFSVPRISKPPAVSSADVRTTCARRGDSQHARDSAGRRWSRLPSYGALDACATFPSKPAVARFPRWVVGSAWFLMAAAHHPHSRKQQCIHLLPILNSRNSAAAVARDHGRCRRGRARRGGGLGGLLPLAWLCADAKRHRRSLGGDTAPGRSRIRSRSSEIRGPGSTWISTNSSVVSGRRPVQLALAGQLRFSGFGRPGRRRKFPRHNHLQRCAADVFRSRRAARGESEKAVERYRGQTWRNA